MTVIVAIKEEDAILIASDGEATDLETRLRDQLRDPKIHRLGNAPVVWGCSGQESVLADFNKWLGLYSWPPKDWQTFQDDVIKKLSKLNGKLRKHMRSAGVEEQVVQKSGAICLLVGWLKDMPEIIEFDDKGRTTSYVEDGFCSIGSGATAAKIALKTLERSHGATVEDKLRIIMGVVIWAKPQCGPPVSIRRVNRNGDVDTLQWI